MRAGDDEILARYLDGERIAVIPKKQARKMLVLQWLVGRFEFDRDYTEREVDEAIAHAHPDFATLRRELYDAFLVDRENGIYRRRRVAANDEAIDDAS